MTAPPTRTEAPGADIRPHSSESRAEPTAINSRNSQSPNTTAAAAHGIRTSADSTRTPRSFQRTGLASGERAMGA